MLLGSDFAGKWVANVSQPIAAALIAVGTELSSGQVLNTNSAWLATRLDELGLEIRLHMTVPDDRPLMRTVLEQAAAQSELVFVTGGLGPTSDDFTREVVAAWQELPLRFNDASWERLNQRAQRLGFKLGPSQQQQCWFPETARVLPNPAGTADAFALLDAKPQVFVLPGPPSEIQALWEAEIHQTLLEILPPRPQTRLYTWQCLGVGEGSLAEQVEAALQGSELTPGLTTGYRAHFPYIEVKLWVPAEQGVQETQVWLDKIEATCVAAGALVLPGQVDVAERLLQALAQRGAESEPVQILDLGSAGALASRLQPGLNTLQGSLRLDISTLWPGQVLDEATAEAIVRERNATEAGLCLLLGAQSETGTWSLAWAQGERFVWRELNLPFRRSAGLQQRYMAELALIYWWEDLHAEL